MAGIEYTLSAADFISQLFPLNLRVAEKTYRVLTKTTNIPFISDNVDMVSSQLEKLLPSEPPADPIFIDIVNGEMVIPRVLFENDRNSVNDQKSVNTQSTSHCNASSCDPVSSHLKTSAIPVNQGRPSTSSTINSNKPSTSAIPVNQGRPNTSSTINSNKPSTSAIPVNQGRPNTSSTINSNKPSTSAIPVHQNQPSTSAINIEHSETTAPQEESGNESDTKSKRYEWRLTTTRNFLTILEEKKKESPESFPINKKMWPEISKELSKTVTHYPSAVQCREKFYALKRGYRKYLSECNQTGNKTPKPFYYEREMAAILDGDPSIKPLVLRSSLGMNRNYEDTDGDTDEGEESGTSSASRPSTPKPIPKKRKFDEMREYFENRDKQFFEMMANMQKSNKEILDKLIEKLGK